jgi:hypothetical protein
MINLKKGHYVPISASQKQEWIREMWEDIKDKSDPCEEAMQSGDTMISIIRRGRVVSINEYRCHAGTDLLVEDFEKLMKEESEE